MKEVEKVRNCKYLDKLIVFYSLVNVQAYRPSYRLKFFLTDFLYLRLNTNKSNKFLLKTLPVDQEN